MQELHQSSNTQVSSLSQVALVLVAADVRLCVQTEKFHSQTEA